MIIDINMHVLPEELFTDRALLDAFIRSVPRAYGEYAYVTKLPGSDEDQIVIEQPKGYQNLNFSKASLDPEARLKIMEQAGLDKAILRTPCWQEWLDVDLCKRVNDNMARVVQQNPDKLMGTATVPPWGDTACIDEVERCIYKLGFVGVELAAHYGTLYLDAEEFRPYFRKLNEMDVPIVVHHTPLPVQYDSLYQFTNIRRSMGRCIDQVIAVNREIFSDLFEECPNLKLIHSMLGGGFFTYTEQIAPRASAACEEHQRFDQCGPELRRHLDKNIYFGITTPVAWSKAQLECAIKEMGADHIIYGSSYPVRMDWVLNGVAHVNSLAISDQEKQLIFCDNARRLFKI